MACTCLTLPRSILINPTAKTHANAQNSPKPSVPKITLHPHISRLPSIGWSQSAGISHGYLSEFRIPLPNFQSRPVRAVSEEGLPAVSEVGIVEDEGSTLVACKACGRAEMEKGCNGEGRIQGGIGAIPGFTWWPIKAYRPCPRFIESGGRYKRQGQSLDEVAFGRKGKDDGLSIKERLKRP